MWVWVVTQDERLQEAMEKIKAICSDIAAAAEGKPTVDEYNGLLMERTAREFANGRAAAFEHVCHWVLRECGMDFEYYVENGRKQHVYLHNGKTELRVSEIISERAEGYRSYVSGVLSSLK